MENKDIVLILLVICVVYLLYCNNLKEKFSETPSSTTVTTPLPKDITLDDIEKMFDRKIQDLNTERSQVSITESIKNLGIIANKIQENGDFTFPANLNVTGDLRTFGNAVAVPIGTVIMWTMETPPPPNTVPNAMVQGYEDDGVICWYPCVGGEVNGITIPDLRGRLVVGQGQVSGTNDNNKNFNNLLKSSGGNVPIRHHKHNITNHRNLGRSQEYEYTNFANSGWPEEKQYTSDNRISGPTGTNYIMNHFNTNTTPYYTILQFWIRIR
jgi:hypothetical protein